MESNLQSTTPQLGMLEGFEPAPEPFLINQLSSQLASIHQELTAKRKREEDEDNHRKQQKLYAVLSKVHSQISEHQVLCLPIVPRKN